MRALAFSSSKWKAKGQLSLSTSVLCLAGSEQMTRNCVRRDPEENGVRTKLDKQSVSLSEQLIVA